MLEALKEAEKAREKGEIPIGAVIVKDGEIIGRGHNLTETEERPDGACRNCCNQTSRQKNWEKP